MGFATASHIRACTVDWSKSSRIKKKTMEEENSILYSNNMYGMNYSGYNANKTSRKRCKEMNIYREHGAGDRSVSGRERER